ncbi:MAG: NUDIX hydrolase [archaeon]
MIHNYAAKAFIVNEKDELLIVKRSKQNSSRQGEWEFPGGKLEAGESPQEALERETKEETNLDVKATYPINIIFYNLNDKEQSTIMVFLCKLLSSEVVLSEEHDKFKWISLEKGKEMLHPYLVADIKKYEKFFQGKT